MRIVLLIIGFSFSVSCSMTQNISFESPQRVLVQTNILLSSSFMAYLGDLEEVFGPFLSAKDMEHQLESVHSVLTKQVLRKDNFFEITFTIDDLQKFMVDLPWVDISEDSQGNVRIEALLIPEIFGSILQKFVGFEMLAYAFVPDENDTRQSYQRRILWALEDYGSPQEISLMLENFHFSISLFFPEGSLISQTGGRMISRKELRYDFSPFDLFDSEPHLISLEYVIPSN